MLALRRTKDANDSPWLCGAARYPARTRDGHERSLEVAAETLYEAIAQALAAFKSNGWVGQIGRGHTITVRVQQPAVEHGVRISEFEKWLGTNGKSPAEMTLKSRLRSILGRP